MVNIIITDAGLAEIVNAENNGTAPVLLTEIGIGTGRYTATASQTALQAEIKRISTISGGDIGDNILHVNIQDAGTDSYVVYELGIFTESGTLFAVVSQESPIIEKAGTSVANISVDIVLSNINPESVTVGDTDFLFNSATTENQGIIELATETEAKAGTDTYRAITPATLDATIEAHDNIVHRSGVETIAGTKSFTSAVVLLKGGTMTGILSFATSAEIRSSVNNDRIVVSGGTSASNGAFLTLNGKENEGYPGRFTLAAVDGSSNHYLFGYPDGTLTWNGKNIVRSVNNVNADAAGNVTISISNISGLQTALDGKAASSHTHTISNVTGLQTALDGKAASSHTHSYLPLSGGTMTGTIRTTLEGIIVGDTDAQSVRISGGTSWDNGASIVVCGKTHSTYPGMFRIKAEDGTNEAILLGKPDGTLTWGGKNVLTEYDMGVGYPDYSAGVDITTAYNEADTYTFTEDGWVYTRAKVAAKNYINGGLVVASSDASLHANIIPVKAGDVLTGGVKLVIFYPMR